MQTPPLSTEVAKLITKALLPLMCLLPAPAFACIVAVGIELSDALSADAVIVGKITDYEVVYVGRTRYARFMVDIQKVVAGTISENLNPDGSVTFTWDNSTFSLPETFEKGTPYFFALRDPASPLPPLRSGSGVIFPMPEREHLTILQAPCADPFIFEEGDAKSRILQQVLETDRDPNRELEILEEFVFERGAFAPSLGDILLHQRQRERLRRSAERLSIKP